MKKDIFSIPNILSFVRILLIPIFVWLYVTAGTSGEYYLAAAVVVASGITDFLDGQIARRCNMITEFGKFLDPLADKILVCAALLALVELQTFPSWVALVIIAREFIVSGLRMVAASPGKVIAASIFGKFKTVLQICAILLFTVKDSLQITLMGDAFSTCFTIFSWLVLLAAVIMTIVSMLDYFYKSREVLGFGKRSAR